MDKPLISVIIPTWNRGELLVRAVRSVLGQSYQNFEVLVCDDGSTDESARNIAGINDPRVAWFAGPHSGSPACARNLGLRQCKGEWIAFLDSDDAWHSEKLAAQLAVLSKTGLEASSTAARYINLEGHTTSHSTFIRKRITFADLVKSNPVTCSSVIISRRIFSQTGYFPEDRNVIEDYAYWLRVAAFSDFAFVQEPLVEYLDNLSASVRSKVCSDAWLQRRAVFSDWIHWRGSNNFYLKALRLKLGLLYIGVYLRVRELYRHLKWIGLG